MPYVQVPKDLTKVKRKVALNLTKRQLICFSLAALVGVPTFFLTRSHIRVDLAVLLMVVICMPFFFAAMYEKDGQPFEQLLMNYIRSRFLRPKIRPYQTDNIYLRYTPKIKKEDFPVVQTTQNPGKTGKTAGNSKTAGKSRPNSPKKIRPKHTR